MGPVQGLSHPGPQARRFASVTSERVGSSFRDPSGFVFRRDGVLFRQIEPPYREDYIRLKESGLLRELVSAGLLIDAVEERLPEGADAVAILRPEPVPFISYPYEWCFSQFKEAALTTLDIHRLALDRGMCLKDASAYNVQFRNGRPILIDTLSFEIYEEGLPWIAYRQFCRHFLAPLALMSLVDVRLSGLLREHIDGIPLDLAGRLLPASTKFKPGLLAHIHLHGKVERSTGAVGAQKSALVSKTAMFGLIDSLRGTIEGLSWKPEGTTWADYYSDTNYSERAMAAKHELVARALDSIDPKPGSCWDLGANNGEFSLLAANRGIQTIAWDADPAAVEKAYLASRGRAELLPLLQDLTNPSPDLGWASQERDGLISRGPADVVMALALIHHLAIGNNVPLPMIVSFLARIGRNAIVEFVPKEDSQVDRLLAGRRDIFDSYSVDHWEAALCAEFEIADKWPIPETRRTLYLLTRK